MVVLGAIIRDCQGGLSVAAAIRLNMTWEAQMTHATAVRFGVTIARCMWEISLLTQVDAFYCSNVKRAGNIVAHLVTMWDVNFNFKLIYTYSFSRGITFLVKLDLI